jgi:hypothetical protein
MKKTKKTKEIKKPEEVQDVDSYSVKITSITPDQEGNNEDLEEVKQQPKDESNFQRREKVHLQSLPLIRKQKRS